jgi:uncharacterized protein (TIGR04551 family)
MNRLSRYWLVLLTTLWGTAALAQGLTPRPGGMGQTPPSKTDTPSGPAEAAPEEEKEEQPDLPALPPWPGQETKQLQLFQLRGYFRFRYDMWHNGNLSLMSTTSGLRAPFYTPISEDPASQLNCKTRIGVPVPGGGDNPDRDLDDDDCPASTLGGANIRLRLEPTINVGEQVRVHSQIDVFDNLVLGSTPDGRSETPGHADLAAFTSSQAPPVAGQNSSTPAIVVKRAWAEVVTPVGPIQFGRMPVHWGMGIFANNGSCPDCNWGDNADRIMGEVHFAGYTFAMGYDFNSSGPSSLGIQPSGLYYGGQAIDIEQLDDVDQLFWVLGRMDPEEVIRDRLDRGQLVLNYGLYLVWRKQDFDYKSDAATSLNPDKDASAWATAFLERHAWSLMPDIWFKLLWKKLEIQFEGLLIGGKVENGSNAIGEDPYTVLQFGWVMRSSYKVLKDTLSFGLEVGMASGDQAEPMNADVNRRRWSPLGLNADLYPQHAWPANVANAPIDTDGHLNELRFNYDYHVDLILFREVLGTVSNAVYFKPWIQYLVVDSFGGRFDLIYSIAHEPVGYPGNAHNLGVELDLDIFYRNIEEKFSASLRYGVLFPLAALDRPEAIYGKNDAADAGVAHTLQGRLVVNF